MEERWLWYLAGVIDSTATITVKIQKDNRLNMGYSANPSIRLSRPDQVDVFFGLFDEYAEEFNIHYQLYDQDQTKILEVFNSDSARKMLEPLLGGMIQQGARAEFLLDEVLPLFEDGQPQTKEEFVEVVKAAEELREKPIESGQGTKYDLAHFRRAWDTDLSE